MIEELTKKFQEDSMSKKEEDLNEYLSLKQRGRRYPYGLNT